MVWQLEKEAESPVRGRGSEDQMIDWDQRGKTSPLMKQLLSLSYLKVARILCSQHNNHIGGKYCIHFFIEILSLFSLILAL